MGSKGKHALHAVLCGAGRNLRMILRDIRLFYVWILYVSMSNTNRRQSPYPEFRYFAVL